MKIEMTRQVEYFDITPDYDMKLGTLFRLFQEAAISHSEQAGFTSKKLVRQGSVWILNKMTADIIRLPRYLETIRIVTWHRGSRGFKAYRDFLIFAGEEKIAAASSLWLFYDLNRKRLIRVPENTARDYTVEEDRVLGIDIDALKPSSSFTPEFTTAITIRSGDYDPQGHVNNAVYFDYLETLAHQAFKGKRDVRNVTMCFQKEIDRTVQQVTAGITDAPPSCPFKIYSSNRIFAFGEIC